MAFQLSPGVTIQEVDLTTIVPQVSTTIGGIAGFFRWGPVNKRVLMDSEFTMSQQYQPPNSNNAVFYYSAASFLAYGNALNIVRANGTGLLSATVSGSLQIPNEDSYFVNNFNGNGGVYGSFAARYPGDLGNSLQVSVCPSSQAYQSNLTALYGITANASPGGLQVLLSSAAAGNVAVGDLIQVGTLTSNGFLTVTGLQGSNVNVTAGSVTTIGTGLSVTRRWKYANQFVAAPSSSVFANTRSAANDQLHVVVIDANGQFNGSSTQGFILEKYPFLSKASDSNNNDSSPAYYPVVLFNRSKYVYWMDHLTGTTNWGNTAQGTSFTAPQLPVTYNLAGGADITVPYNFTSFSAGISDPNDAGLITAFAQFGNIDDVDVSLIPLGPASPTVQQWVVDNIVTQRLDCVAFLSPRYQDVVNQFGNEASNIVNNYLPALSRASSYVVVDSGWKYMFDRWNQTYRYIPLNGDIAGLCVRTDTVRDPWFSPAGYNRGQIKNLAKLAWNPSNLSGTAYRDLLYNNGVNPVVTFKGAGTVLFGDKTLQFQPSAFDRINVRRLFIILEKSISTAAKFSLFEFNDNFTRAAFVNMVEPFLRTIKGRRGIYDYKVVCDTTNNTPQIIDADQFVGDIYIKPARSINYITLHFIAVGTGVDFQTIVGQF